MYLDTIQVKSKILNFKDVLFMQIWLTYGTTWVSENIFSNFEDLNNFVLSEFFLFFLVTILPHTLNKE
jgi:hypothetical protein